MPVTYSTLLQQILDAMDLTDKRAHQYLQDKGISLSYPAFWSYRSFHSVPTFERAKAILSGFDYGVGDDSLQEILEYSRQELKTNRLETKKYVSKGFRINPKLIDKSLSADELENIMMERARTLIGPNASLNNYLTELVRLDLIETGYVNISSEGDDTI